MPATLFRRTLSVSRLVVLLFVALLGIAHAATPNGIIISQLYGAGGNSGATLNADYVELFNPTGSPISLSGYSVQYASAAGASISSTIALSNVTLQPGQYYLLSATPGGTGSSFTADQTSNQVAFGAAAGRVYLSNSTSTITSPGCAPFTNSAILDSIPYGTTTSCANAAPAPSTTKSDFRVNTCNITGNPATDYTTAAPAPRNSSTVPAPCPSTGGTTTIGVSGSANPNAIFTGSTTLLTATITPSSSSPNATISVTADLSKIGGSSTQALLDDGKNGDVAANDNIFSYSTAVNTTGSFSFPVTATDNALHSGNGTIALTVTTPPQTLAIDQINGTGATSPYVGQTVLTSGIVTAVLSNGFYIQTPDTAVDADPNTPEGLFIFRGSTVLPSYIIIGNKVQVSGVVTTYPTTGTYTPETELASPTFSLLSTGNVLPTPIVIGTAQDSPTGGINQFHKYEGMRVAIASLTTTEGTDANLTESTETNVSNGQFWGVVTGIARPYREPGIAANDATYTTPIPSTIPIFDNNPELLFIDSLATGGPAIDVTAQATLTGVSGVMDFANGYAAILLDAANRPVVSGLITPQAIPAPTANEFTIASFNMERFYTSDSTAAKNPGSSVVVVTPTAYQRRLQKVSLAIRNILNSPDIIGAQEIQDLQVLTDVANQVSKDAIAASQPDPAYTPYLFLANDGTGINTGFLVKGSRVTTLKVEQFGLNTTFTNAVGAQAILNDRTPLVLHAGIKRAGSTDYPLTVIDVHQRSLNGVDDPSTTGQTVRLKREAQAEYLANLIQSYQSAGEHVVTVGDYNSFQFSDGFVDVLGVVRGNPVPANQVVVPPVANITTPNLIDLVTTLPAAQQQSYTFAGNAQVLDHVVITQDLLPYVDRIVQAHFDADFPLINLNDATTPSRVSDHDPAVAYFAIPPAGPIAGTVQLATKATLTRTASGYQATVTVTNSGTGTAQAVTLTGATLGSVSGTPLPQTFGNVAPNGGIATFTVNFPVSAGASGTASVERLTGTYTGGTFGGSLRVTLP